ncbi:MAG TPA: serine hydrolase domain-containing protein, partial [Ilumatobacteraceae bacterium]|nr:serine hydrolase domain-containing protein [Ilumatobacteraceae bacterium]
MQIPIGGHCDERFSAVRTAFADNFADRGEVGAAVCVVIDGEQVVDLVGGWADEARTREWQHDTLVDFYSVGKALVALLALQLVDAGMVRLDDPIASVWPEFA